MREGYIFVYQDVRGTFMSEGEFEDVRPHIPNKKSPKDIDESSDTYDTIDWLVKNIPNNNGRVGVWGISYPGFYAATALMDAHPALKAASPQAPIADWFVGDDDHHNGAFFIFDCFGFNMFFGMPRPEPTANQFKNFDYGTPDAYKFFLELGPVANAQKNYFKGKNKYWNDVTAHGTYDEFWQARNVLPHLKKVTPAVMVVGGWFDAEDLYGPLNIYRDDREKQSRREEHSGDGAVVARAMGARRRREPGRHSIRFEDLGLVSRKRRASVLQFLPERQGRVEAAGSDDFRRRRERVEIITINGRRKTCNRARSTSTKTANCRSTRRRTLRIRERRSTNT